MNKNRIIATLLLLFIVKTATAQIQFEQVNDLKELLTKAQKANKLIFIQVKAEGCDQCNDVAKIGLSSAVLNENIPKILYLFM